MFGIVVPLIKAGAWYAGTVLGARTVQHVVAGVTEKVAPEQAPVVAGFGDGLMNLLDPFDITGMKKRKEDQQNAQLQAAQHASQKQKDNAKAASAKAKEAQKRAQQAEAKAREADKRAARAERAASEAAKRGEMQKARMAAQQAQQQRRWATLSRRAAAEANAKSTTDPNGANAMALAAMELAKLAIAPQNAIDAINAQSTPEGKSLVASLVDAMSREGEPDYDQLLSRLQAGDPDAAAAAVELSESYDDGDYFLDGVVSGACCSACKVGRSCGSDTGCGAGRGEVPDALVSGEIIDFGEEDDGGDFLRWAFNGDGENVSGTLPDDDVRGIPGPVLLAGPTSYGSSFRQFMHTGGVDDYSADDDGGGMFGDASLVGPDAWDAIARGSRRG